MSIDEEYLSTWFVINYIGECAQLCPVYISRLLDDVSTCGKLLNAVLQIVRWRLDESMHDWWLADDSTVMYIAESVSTNSVTARSCVYWMKELARVKDYSSVFYSAVALLHVAYKIRRSGFNKELMEILSTILGRNIIHRWCIFSCLCKTELNTSELVKFLQKCAVEHLTIFRWLILRDFASVGMIVTTDFEALYAYKRGDYQRCLQLSTQHVHALLYAVDMSIVPTHREFIQLMDDDIVSLVALTLIINPKCRERSFKSCIKQLILSLYLMTQCQLKLRSSVTSLAQTLQYIKVTQRRLPRDRTLDHLTLKLTERKVCLTTWH